MFGKAISLIAILLGIAVAVTPAPNTAMAIPDGMTPAKLAQMGTSLTPEAYQAWKVQLAPTASAYNTPTESPRVAGGNEAVGDFYPSNSNYQTGSLLTTGRTQTSLVYGSNQSAGTTDRGWWVFNISAIPQGSLINSVVLHAYCVGQYYPYWALTRVTATDPRTDANSNVYTDLDYNSNNGESPTYYYYSYSNAASGWNTIDLGTYGKSDLTNKLTAGWFAVGLTDFDNYYYYWLEFQGWNESNKPYITVNYNPPVANDLGVTKILSPIDPFYAFGDTLWVKAIVKNWGTAPQTNAPIRCRMRDAGGTIMYDQVVNINISALQVETISFPVPGTPPAVEMIYTDSIRSELTGDQDPSNNAQVNLVTVTQYGSQCMTYNDGTFDNAISWVAAGNQMAELFVPPMNPIGINKAELYISSFSGADYAAEVRIYGNDGGSGKPGTQLGAWVGNLHSSIWTALYKNEVYFVPPIMVTYDSFFVSYYQTSISPAYPYLGMDYTQPVTTGNDWGTYNGGAWATFPYDTYMDFGINGCYQARLLDGTIVDITNPPAVIDSNVAFDPTIVVKNVGLKARTNIPVAFNMYRTSDPTDTIYAGTANSGPVGIGQSKAVPFTGANLTPIPGDGNFTMTGISNMPYDTKTDNDTLSMPLFVRYYDVRTSISSPRKQEVPGLVPVSIKLTNHGNVPVTVPRLDVTIAPAGYGDYRENIAIPVGGDQIVTLNPWVCPAGGQETCTAWITDPSDMNPGTVNDGIWNDTAKTAVTTGIPGWMELTSMPAPPTGKMIKDGAWLAYDAGTDLIYGSKGNKTGDFYAYDVAAGAWATKTGIPLGAEEKQVYKGSVGCSDGNGKLYMTKGNNTIGFWNYDAGTGAWTQLTNVPLGSSGKKVKQGAGLAWATKNGTGAVYLLKGYRNEFHKYDPATNSWVQLLDAPIGTANHIKWDAGSWLVADADAGNMLYAFKAKYHEMYTYDTDADTWSHAKHAMPIPGSNGNKKAKDGSSAAWYSGKIYAFKGGNTTEFWRYFPLGDSWHKQDDIPLVGTSGQRKKVKAGAALAGYPGTGVYGFKGNKSLEFWRYTPYDVVAGAQPSRDGVTAGSVQIGSVSFAIAPNPLSGGYASVRYSLPKAGLATLNVFDVTGRTVLSQTLAAGRTGTASLDLRKLEAGVYLVKVATEGFSTTQKLVVEH